MGYVVSGPKASLWEAFDHVARGWIPGRRLHEGCSISNTAPFSLAVGRAIAVALDRGIMHYLPEQGADIVSRSRRSPVRRP